MGCIRRANVRSVPTLDSSNPVNYVLLAGFVLGIIIPFLIPLSVVCFLLMVPKK